MSKQYILKDIERLKKANAFLKTLFAGIKNYKSEEGTSYPVGVPNFSSTDEFQINYNEMCIDILEYFVEKLGDKEELHIGKYFTCWLDMCETRIRIGFTLNDKVSAKLYNDVFGSWSTIYTWSQQHILSLLSLITFKYLDLVDAIYFFEHIGTDVNSKERRLAWDASTYTKSADDAKNVIDDIFRLAEDEEVTNDIDEVLDVYFGKVFKHNEEEY